MRQTIDSYIRLWGAIAPIISEKKKYLRHVPTKIEVRRRHRTPRCARMQRADTRQIVRGSMKLFCGAFCLCIVYPGLHRGYDRKTPIGVREVGNHNSGHYKNVIKISQG